MSSWKVRILNEYLAEGSALWFYTDRIGCLDNVRPICAPLASKINRRGPREGAYSIYVLVTVRVVCMGQKVGGGPFIIVFEPYFGACIGRRPSSAYTGSVLSSPRAV